MTATKKQDQRRSQYLVYRLGANSANQPYTDRLPIAVVEAKNRKTACGAVASRQHSGHCLAGNILASVGDLTVYGNQTLYAVPKLENFRKNFPFPIDRGPTIQYDGSCDVQRGTSGSRQVRKVRDKSEKEKK